MQTITLHNIKHF